MSVCIYVCYVSIDGFVYSTLICFCIHKEKICNCIHNIHTCMYICLVHRCTCQHRHCSGQLVVKHRRVAASAELAVQATNQRIGVLVSQTLAQSPYPKTRNPKPWPADGNPTRQNLEIRPSPPDGSRGGRRSQDGPGWRFGRV